MTLGQPTNADPGGGFPAAHCDPQALPAEAAAAAAQEKAIPDAAVPPKAEDGKKA